MAFWGATGYRTFTKELPPHLMLFLAGTKKGNSKPFQGSVHKALVLYLWLVVLDGAEEALECQPAPLGLQNQLQSFRKNPFPKRCPEAYS